MTPTPTLPSVEISDIERIFVDVIADAIRHMKQFIASRKSSPFGEPSRLELVGEFATHLRRYDKQFVSHGFPHFGNKKYWYHIARPDSYYWTFTYKGCDGERKMDQLHATNLCNMASKRVEEEPDVDAKLNELKRSAMELDIYVSTARKLNAEAETVLSNLCVTAEKLQ